MGLKSYLKAFIPQKVSGKTVAGFLKLGSLLGRPGKRKISRNLDINIETIKSHIPEIEGHKGYIENQDAYRDVKYASKDMRWGGCGVFATYNSLVNLRRASLEDSNRTDTYAELRDNEKESKAAVISPAILPELISYYEKKGAVFGARLGTSPLSVLKFFLENGFDAKISYKEADFEGFGREYDTFILTAYMDGSDISKNVHYIAISKEGGYFTPHNVYCNGKVFSPSNTLTGAIKSINNGKAKGMCLIGIKNGTLRNQTRTDNLE
ncbi:MAG: hypothetical protein IJ195_01150 [Lachnospiraceae bacterium]|nr:hypothetical protein [Lachnospiraceae bacterium]